MDPYPVEVEQIITNSSGCFASMSNCASSESGKSRRFAVTMTWAPARIAPSPNNTPDIGQYLDTRIRVCKPGHCAGPYPQPIAVASDLIPSRSG